MLADVFSASRAMQAFVGRESVASNMRLAQGATQMIWAPFKLLL